MPTRKGGGNDSDEIDDLFDPGGADINNPVFDVSAATTKRIKDAAKHYAHVGKIPGQPSWSALAQDYRDQWIRGYRTPSRYVHDCWLHDARDEGLDLRGSAMTYADACEVSLMLAHDGHVPKTTLALITMPVGNAAVLEVPTSFCHGDCERCFHERELSQPYEDMLFQGPSTWNGVRDDGVWPRGMGSLADDPEPEIRALRGRVRELEVDVEDLKRSR